MLINDLLGSEKQHSDVPDTPAEHSAARHCLKSSNSELKLGSRDPLKAWDPSVDQKISEIAIRTKIL